MIRTRHHVASAAGRGDPESLDDGAAGHGRARSSGARRTRPAAPGRPAPRGAGCRARWAATSSRTDRVSPIVSTWSDWIGEADAGTRSGGDAWAATDSSYTPPKTSTGPAPAPYASPCRTAFVAADLAPAAASRSGRPRASSAASVEECVQPAPCVVRRASRTPDEARHARCASQSTSSAVAPWPPVTITAQPWRVVQHLREARGVVDVQPGQRLRLVQVRRHHGRQGQQQRAVRVVATGRQQRRSGLGAHHGVDARRGSRRPGRGRRSSAATAATVSAVPSMPVLTPSSPMSAATSRIWSRTNAGGVPTDVVDAGRGLCRQRGHGDERERRRRG